MILDKFTTRPWRPILKEYQQGKISVGVFNSAVFALVKADKQTLIDFVNQTARVRPGLKELLTYCHNQNIEFIITSNGLDFYIEFILENLGIKSVKVNAARSHFHPDGMKVKYIGPDGNELLEKYKETYTKLFISQGYGVIYIGNGASDFPAAKLCHCVFACEDLITACKANNLPCIPFNDLNDVLEKLKNPVENPKY
jgi:2-hydroxy-3-keto-5-methylthiopentenyl-1-phosphate phosphatase